jgi:hypothetical protein
MTGEPDWAEITEHLRRIRSRLGWAVFLLFVIAGGVGEAAR